MDIHNGELAALIGSRICHDLISPIGAINNGLELLDITGETSGPEMDLISESVCNADARIRFFRIAFGAAGEQEVGIAEVQGILDAVSKAGRVSFQWDVDGTLSRSMVRLAFLAMQCCESAMPYGGNVSVELDDGVIVIQGIGAKITVEERLWTTMSKPSGLASSVTPALVQFALLPLYAKEANRSIRVHSTPESLTVTLQPQL